MHPDKALLGSRYACFKCGTKFYDLNRPEPTCPECGADQREAPVRDIRALLSGGRRSDLSDSSMSGSMDSEEDEEDDDFDDFGVDGDDDDNDNSDDDADEDAGGMDED